MRYATRRAALDLPTNAGAMETHLSRFASKQPTRRRAPHDTRGPLGLALFGLGLVLLSLTGSFAGVARAASPNDSLAVLSWEAPGDDGTTGVASRYELRYRTTTVVGSDTLGWWSAATPLASLPLPSAAGVTDSVVVRGLNPGLNYFFMLRVADEVPNWSGFSNLVAVTPLYDTTPPASISDLRVEEVSPAPGTEGQRPAEQTPTPPK